MTALELALKPIIVSTESHSKGKLFTFRVGDKRAAVLFMTHAMERMVKWALSPNIVGETLLNPEEVLTGHHNRFIAHRCYGQHILRAIYEYENTIPSLVTVYFPYKERYYRGGGSFEDKILE